MRATGVASPVTSAAVYARWASGLSDQRRQVFLPKVRHAISFDTMGCELRCGWNYRIHKLRNCGNKLSRGEWFG
jgi:hypothetical protein